MSTPTQPEDRDARKLINIVLGLLDAPKGANVVFEVATLIANRDELQAKADDYDRLAEVARERRRQLDALAPQQAGGGLPDLPKAFKVESPKNSEPYSLFTARQMIEYRLAAAPAAAVRPHPDGSTWQDLESAAAMRAAAEPSDDAKAAEDAARYRWLRENCKEEPLRPASYGSELAPDMRLKHSFPVLVSYDAIGQQITLDEAIDAALSTSRKPQP